VIASPDADGNVAVITAATVVHRTQRNPPKTFAGEDAGSASGPSQGIEVQVWVGVERLEPPAYAL
jgi:hypothetical protein